MSCDESVMKHMDVDIRKEYSAIFMPKSITVQAGQRVRRGDVIALCGNSGNTSEPHIHFQVQNTKGFYSSLGLPIRFKSVNIIPTTNYEKADLHPIPEYENIESGYLVRGLTVENEV